MKAIVVMNGEFYAGEDADYPNKLMFTPNRKKAVVVDERRLRYITQNVLRWFMGGEIVLNRLEILRIGGDKNVQMS